MNSIIQNTLVFSALILAVIFIVKTYIWSPKKKNTKACGGDDGCGCH